MSRGRSAEEKMVDSSNYSTKAENNSMVYLHLQMGLSKIPRRVSSNFLGPLKILPPLLMGMKTCIITLEISIAVSQKISNQPTSGPSNTTLGHIPKIFPIIHLFLLCS